MLISIMWDWTALLLLFKPNFPYWIFYLFFSPSGRFWLLSRITFSTLWFRSASHHLAKASSTVQFLLTSSGNDTLYNGTFLFLTGSVVRPEEVLFSKPQCCNLHSEKCTQYKTLSLFSSQADLEICEIANNIFLCCILSFITLMWRFLSGC